MADVNLQVVREYFELNLFRVLTNWQQDSARQRPSDAAPQLFVENTAAASDDVAVPFLLRPGDVADLSRAVVEVRAWHADRFYPSVIEANPVLWQFAQDENLTLARELFRDQTFTTILVVSELPASTEQRTKALALLENAGVGHVLEFPGVLQGLLEKVSESANYGSSQTLQTLRLLKRYRFVRNQQMEFPFLTEAPVPEASPGNDAELPALETADLLAEMETEPEAEAEDA